MRDNGNIGTGTPVCTYAASQNPHDWWPNALYDAREGNYRPAGAGTGVATTSPMMLGGVMNYVSLDVNNLRRWLAGTIPAVGSTGPQTLNVNGYIVYFSDRRGDHNENDLAIPNRETGEYGSENFVNPLSSAACRR